MDRLEPENADNSMEWEEDSGFETLGASVGGTTSVDPNLMSEYDFSQPSTSGNAGQKRKLIFPSPLPSKMSRSIWNPKKEQEHLSVYKINLFEHHEVASGLSTPQHISEIVLGEPHISTQETRQNTSSSLASGGIDYSKKGDSADNIRVTSDPGNIDCSVKKEMVLRKDMPVVSIDNTGAASGQTENISGLEYGRNTEMMLRRPNADGQQPNPKERFSEAEGSERDEGPFFVVRKTLETLGIAQFMEHWANFYERPKKLKKHLESHGISDENNFMNYIIFRANDVQCKICGTSIYNRLPGNIRKEK